MRVQIPPVLFMSKIGKKDILFHPDQVSITLELLSNNSSFLQLCTVTGPNGSQSILIPDSFSILQISNPSSPLVNVQVIPNLHSYSKDSSGTLKLTHLNKKL